jgi:phenylacetate-CoA ligase
MVNNWLEVLRSAGVTQEDKVFCAFSFGPFIGFWLAFEAAQRMGCLALPGGGLSSTARLQSIFDQAATVLCCTPTYALRLAEVAAAENIDRYASPLRLIIVAGEPGGSIPATRQRIEELWPGARVVDHHGMTEVGPVTFECPARPGTLHVIETSYLPEIIHQETGRHIETGQVGELVLTPLGRLGMPVLRYRTGDLVKSSLDTLCECGRSDLALDGGILGRTDDMVVVRGVNVYPNAVEDIIRGSGKVAEYRVEVSQVQGLAELNIEIEPTPDCSDAAGLARQLERAFETAFALRVPVRVAAPNALPRFELKAKRWLRKT